MKFSLLKEYEQKFHRTPFKASSDVASLSPEEQRWFVYQFQVKDDSALAIETVEEWNIKELTDAVSDFFGVVLTPIPSLQTSIEPSGN